MSSRGSQRFTARAFLLLAFALPASAADPPSSIASRVPAAGQQIQIDRAAAGPVSAVVPARPRPPSELAAREGTVRQWLRSVAGADEARNAVLLPGDVSVTLSGHLVASANPAAVAEMLATPYRFQPVAYAGAPLRRNPQDTGVEGDFLGTLVLALVPLDNVTPNLYTEKAVRFHVYAAEGGPPDAVDVRPTADPVSVDVRVRNPQPPVTLQVALQGGDRISVPIPLKPTLLLAPDTLQVPGDGRGTANISVWALTDRKNERGGHRVVFTASPTGQFDPATPITLDESGFGSATLKSAGTGSTLITASTPGFDPGRALIEFTAIQRTLTIAPSSIAIEGWGVGKHTFHVVANADDRPDKLIVTIDLGGKDGAPPSGTLDSYSVELDRGRGHFIITSGDPRKSVAITVSAPGYTSATASVDYNWPYRTLIACLLGALFGGILRLLSRRGRSRTWKRTVQDLAASVFAGVLTFVLYIIGVNVLPVEPTQRTGEIVAFALAALAALIGVSLLPGKEHASADTPPSPPATPPQASPS